MWLYFNKQGQLITSLEHGEIARAGTTQFSIFAVFEGLDSSIPNIKAAIKLFKPDLYGSSYPVLIMDAAVKEFVLQSGENANNVLPFKTSDSPYHGFYFDFANFNTGQDTEVLLDTDGLWTAVITLVSGDRTLNVQGVATFNVAQGIVSQDGTDIDIDTVLLQILQEVAKKLDIDSGIVVIQNTNIPPENLEEFENGQLFFSRDDKKLFELVITGEEPPYTYTLVSYSNFADLNIENGDGLCALQQEQDGTSGTFDFTNKNPNATALDPTLTGEIAYGGVGNFATSFGGKSQASGKRSLAEGTTTIAKGNYSHAEGDNSVAYGNDSHAEGFATLSAGLASHTEGSKTQVLTTLPESGGGGDTPVDPPSGWLPDEHRGEASHAEGSETIVYGCSSHAEGANTIVKGHYAHAEGVSTMAVGTGSKSYGNHSTANGDYSVAGGSYTTANQIGSFAHGYGASTYAEYSTAFGDNTQTVRRAQFAVGIYNIGKTTTLFEVGNGTVDSRSNALEVHSDGRVTVGAAPVDNMDVVTKQYADSVIAGVYKLGGSETVTDLNDMTKTASMDGNVYNMISSGQLINYAGDTVSVNIGDNVAFIWRNGDYYWDNMVGFIDTSNLVDKTSSQNITGLKTIINELDFKYQDSSTVWKLQAATDYVFKLMRNSTGLAQYSTGGGFEFNNKLVPGTGNTYDLGASGSAWSNLYLSGTLYHTGYQFIWNSAYSQLRLADGSGNLRYAFNMDHSTTPISFYSYNQMDLGASNYQWKDLYLSGKIDLGTKVSGRTNTCKIELDNYDGIGLWSNGVRVLNIYDNATYTAKPIFPNTTGINLGTSTTRFATIFATNINVSGNLEDGTYSYTIADSYKMLFNIGISTGSSATMELDYIGMYTIGLITDTTITFKAAPTVSGVSASFYPEYKAIFNNVDNVAHTITLPSGIKILCNDDNITINNNIVTVPAGTKIETSTVNLCMIIVNFEAQ